MDTYAHVSKSGMVSDNSSIDSEDMQIVDVKQQLLTCLEGIQWSGSFAAFEKLDDFVDPRILVPSVGPVDLPLKEETARALIQTCNQAPFGKNEETVIDTSVRNTWELNPDKFQLRNPDWAKYVKRITWMALKQLGFGEQGVIGVRAELYKMLLYEKGALFKPHKEYVPFATPFLRLTLQQLGKGAGNVWNTRHMPACYTSRWNSEASTCKGVYGLSHGYCKPILRLLVCLSFP
jgi:hypothetical protein